MYNFITAIVSCGLQCTTDLALTPDFNLASKLNPLTHSRSLSSLCCALTPFFTISHTDKASLESELWRTASWSKHPETISGAFEVKIIKLHIKQQFWQTCMTILTVMVKCCKQLVLYLVCMKVFHVIS